MKRITLRHKRNTETFIDDVERVSPDEKWFKSDHGDWGFYSDKDWEEVVEEVVSSE